jgi:hypothetical protein
MMGAWRRGCLVLSSSGGCLINNRCSAEETGLLPDNLCRLVVAVQSFSGRPLWNSLRLEASTKPVQASVVDRGGYMVVMVSSASDDPNMLVLEGLHIAHILQLTFATELADAINKDDAAQKAQGDQYSVSINHDLYHTYVPLCLR